MLTTDRVEEEPIGTNKVSWNFFPWSRKHLEWRNSYLRSADNKPFWANISIWFWDVTSKLTRRSLGPTIRETNLSKWNLQKVLPANFLSILKNDLTGWKFGQPLWLTRCARGETLTLRILEKPKTWENSNSLELNFCGFHCKVFIIEQIPRLILSVKSCTNGVRYVSWKNIQTSPKWLLRYLRLRLR